MSILNSPEGILKMALVKLGVKTLSDHQEERIAICKGCNKNTLTCPVCNCLVEAKAMIKEEKCPKQLWNE